MIQIDMEMPKSCAECRLRNYQAACCCMAMKTYENTAGFEENRPEWCPLKDPVDKPSVVEQIQKCIISFANDMGEMPGYVFISQNTHDRIKEECKYLYPPQGQLTYPTIYGARINSTTDDMIFIVGKAHPIRPSDMLAYSLEKGEPIL